MDFGVGANLTGAVAGPFNNQQKQPVGEQNSGALDTSLPPVEQIGQGAAAKRPSDEGPTDVQQQAERERAGRDARNDQMEQNRTQEQVRELARRDREVRSHERTHTALAGRYAGAALYEFKKGPNGVLYAVAGSVSIDTSPIPDNPEATLRKAQIIQRAAMGPSDPSSADGAIASKARAMAAAASADLARELQQSRERVEAKGVVDGRGTIREGAAEEIRNTEQSDNGSEAQGEDEVVEKRPQQIDLSLQLIDVALNKKLVELGVFKEANSTGTVLDLTA